MTTSEISRDIIGITCELLPVSSEMVTPEARFIEDLGADSIQNVELLMQIEEHFSIDIPDEHAEKLVTMGDVTNYIYSKLTGSPVQLPDKALRQIVRTDCY